MCSAVAQLPPAAAQLSDKYGCLSETWTDFNQLKGMRVVALILLRTFLLYRECQKGKLGCQDSTRARW